MANITVMMNGKNSSFDLTAPAARRILKSAHFNLMAVKLSDGKMFPEADKEALEVVTELLTQLDAF